MECAFGTSMPRTAPRCHSIHVESKTRASCLTGTARCPVYEMPQAAVRDDRSNKERHETSPLRAMVICWGCGHNLSVQRSKMALYLLTGCEFSGVQTLPTLAVG